MVGFTCRNTGPHGHQRSATVARRTRKDVHVNVRDFLPGKGSVVNADGEILRRKMLSKALLHLCNTGHE